MARVAGSLLPLFLAAILALPHVAAAEPAVAESANGLLLPRGTLQGGLPAPALPIGPAATIPTPPGGYVRFIRPDAVAAHGRDAWVADSGLSALLRIDLPTQTISRLATLPPGPGIVLRSGPDGTLYLIRPDRSSVQRMTRDGRGLVSHADPANLLQPRDLVVEPILGRVWIADLSGEVFEFHPSGALFEPLRRRDSDAGEKGPPLLGPLAAGGGLVAAWDGRCSCLVALDREGVAGERLGSGLLSPSSMAIDNDRRIWTIDRADRLIKVFAQGRLVARLAPASLGLFEFTALAIDQQHLFIADSPGGRIALFDLLPPAKGAP